MNLLLFDRSEIDDDGLVALGSADRRAHHLTAVLKAQTGQVLRAGLVRGPLGTAEVLSVTGGELRLRVTASGEPCQPAPTAIILAVPRPKVLSRILQAAAAFAVRRIDLVNSWRVDKSYLDSPRLEAAAIAGDLQLGCEQGVTTWMPEVVLHRRLMPLFERLGDHVGDARRLCAHPGAVQTIEAAVTEPGRVTAIAIGPEGGWIDRELASFEEHGFTLVRLGTPILRVEAAFTAACAQLSLLDRLRR